MTLIVRDDIKAVKTTQCLTSKVKRGIMTPTPQKYFCTGNRLVGSFWVNKSRDIVFFEKFDLKSVWAKA